MTSPLSLVTTDLHTNSKPKRNQKRYHLLYLGVSLLYTSPLYAAFSLPNNLISGPRPIYSITITPVQTMYVPVAVNVPVSSQGPSNNGVNNTTHVNMDYNVLPTVNNSFISHVPLWNGNATSPVQHTPHPQLKLHIPKPSASATPTIPHSRSVIPISLTSNTNTFPLSPSIFPSNNLLSPTVNVGYVPPMIASTSREQNRPILEEEDTTTPSLSPGPSLWTKRGKRFFCNQCGKSSTRKSNLILHLRTHETDITKRKPFLCKECGTRLTQKHSLKDHMRIHTGEKPFGCEFCNKRFKVKHNMMVHRRIHTGEKPYLCIICQKKFRCKSLLNTHNKSIHRQLM